MPYKVVAKFSPDHVPAGTKSNIMVLDKIPQKAILSHKNTRAFFTHCGMHGVMESIYWAVPIIGMPIFLDQYDILTKVVERGIGLGVDKWSTKDDIAKAIQTVVSEPK